MLIKKIENLFNYSGSGVSQLRTQPDALNGCGVHRKLHRLHGSPLGILQPRPGRVPVVRIRQPVERIVRHGHVRIPSHLPVLLHSQSRETARR